MTSGAPARAAGEPRPKKAQRVRKRAEFLGIQARGARVTGDCLVFIVLTRPPGESATRLGITASRKIGNAVQRNRAKRLIREAFRRVSSALPAGLDCVVIVRRPLESRKLADILVEWERALPNIRRKAASSAPRPER